LSEASREIRGGEKNQGSDVFIVHKIKPKYTVENGK
jgi:hypothetical protein